ncbi:MAG: hydantoinase/oxoprolinase family protein [Anaerolineae bacterium]|jgi:N-methylhydantoinase A/oxoprolinase/acetone carboxylase beta subunit
MTDMTIALGIDTGGTYTDAVLVDHDSGAVLASAKALTTRRDLSIGISEAVRAVFAQNGLGASERDEAPITPADVDLVALSTTLATNAIVEGQGSPVCLLLIGYDAELIRQYGFEGDLVTRDVVYLRGGHDGLGEEVAPLDEAAARQAILDRRERVEAFAISGYFGVRNPSHELRVRDLVQELAGPSQGLNLSVTCGHELTTRLNAVRRATTTALNAQLIPLLKDLIATVRRSLDELEIAAPLMVVKGDGSLVRAAWAMQRPIETILSGPAASVVGAWHLASRRDVWVVDVGGTTTDIAVLQDGRPRVNPQGAQVGRWRTMVEAVDVHTVGLGGDSQVCVNHAYAHASNTHPAHRQWLSIGPRRVVPLCLLASQHPQVVPELQHQVERERSDSQAGQFLLAHRRPAHALSEDAQEVLEHLAQGPLSLLALGVRLRHSFLLSRQVESLRARRLVLQAGFTPTDALHVLGRFERWEVEASRLGAELLAAQAGLSPQDFCQKVVLGVSDRVATELVSKVLSDEVALPHWENEPVAAALLAWALGDSAQGAGLDCRLSLRQPVVAIGAPVEAYLPRAARQLHTELIIPEHAGVANALGAVAGGVVQQMRVIINPLDQETSFRLHLPDGVHDFDTLEESVAYAQRVVPGQVDALARQAGADQVEVKVLREDHIVRVKGGWGQEVFLRTQLTFTAVGRPSLA